MPLARLLSPHRGSRARQPRLRRAACFSRIAWSCPDASVARCPKWGSPQTPAAIMALATPPRMISHQDLSLSKKSKMRMTAMSPSSPTNTANAAHSTQLVLVANATFNASTSEAILTSLVSSLKLSRNGGQSRVRVASMSGRRLLTDGSRGSTRF
jgi:hypothetical protein